MRNNFFHIVNKMVLAALTVVIVTFISSIDVQATGASAIDLTSGPMIVVEKYEVTDEKIVPGEDFTLTLTLANYNQSITARDVIIDIDNPNGVAPIYGTVSQVYVGNIAPGESKEISIDYNSWTSITGETLDFYVTVITSMNQNYIVLRIPSGSDSPFSVISANIPETVEKDSTWNMSLAFKVLGEQNVRDVALTVSRNGQKIADSLVGIVTPGVTKTQQLSTIFGEPGEYAVDIGLEYVDNAGQIQTDVVGTAIVTVTEEGSSVTNDFQTGHHENNSNGGVDNLLLMGVSGMLILGIFLVVVFIVKKNK